MSAKVTPMTPTAKLTQVRISVHAVGCPGTGQAKPTAPPITRASAAEKAIVRLLTARQRYRKWRSVAPWSTYDSLRPWRDGCHHEAVGNLPGAIPTQPCSRRSCRPLPYLSQPALWFRTLNFTAASTRKKDEQRDRRYSSARLDQTELKRGSSTERMPLIREWSQPGARQQPTAICAVGFPDGMGQTAAFRVTWCPRASSLAMRRRVSRSGSRRRSK